MSLFDSASEDELKAQAAENLGGFSVVIPWDKPQVKERPRFANGRVYTPKRTLDAEKLIAQHWAEQGLPVLDETIAVDITFTNKNILVEIFPHDDYKDRSLRGDLDNYVKIVLDALNEVAFEDDKQIVALSARKV